MIIYLENRITVENSDVYIRGGTMLKISKIDKKSF